MLCVTKSEVRFVAVMKKRRDRRKEIYIRWTAQKRERERREYGIPCALLCEINWWSRAQPDVIRYQIRGDSPARLQLISAEV